MSWPVLTYAIVFAVLLGGWIAYERSRPSARTVALVATLCALAALGRDAFAAIDEVKPITAMTFVVGWTLGPLPGFVVGAGGMLVSNLMLGQGPYTPWQMAAWGCVGLLGAGAGRLSHRRAARLQLAFGSALAALFAKEVMNVYVWTVGAAHTPAALLGYVATGFSFDVVDVASTFLFGLAFGPELVRLLARMRARSTVHWEPPPGSVACVALVLVIAAGANATGAKAAQRADANAADAHAVKANLSQTNVAYVNAADTHAATPHRSGASAQSASGGNRSDRAIARAAGYLASAQNKDGGFAAEPHRPSAGMYTSWAVIGFAAAGRDPRSVEKDGRSACAALRTQASALKDAGSIERAILALRACGQTPRTAGAHSLLSLLMRHRQRDGSFDGQVNLTAFAILALRASAPKGERAFAATVAAASRWILRQQNSDGGFSFASHGDPSDIDDTAAAMQAIVVARAEAEQARKAAARAVAEAGLRRALSRASGFLRRVEDQDGGFPLEPSEESNAQSTAWAIQGLLAASRLSTLARERAPIRYLESLMQPNGSIRYSRHSDQTPVWVTAEALAALARKPLPVAPVTERRERTHANREKHRAEAHRGQEHRAEQHRTRTSASGADRIGLAAQGAAAIAARLLSSVSLLLADRS